MGLSLAVQEGSMIASPGPDGIRLSMATTSNRMSHSINAMSGQGNARDDGIQSDCINLASADFSGNEPGTIRSAEQVRNSAVTAVERGDEIIEFNSNEEDDDGLVK